MKLVQGIRKPPVEALIKSRIAQGVFDKGLFEVRFAKGIRALERAKARGHVYYEKKLVKLEAFVERTKYSAANEYAQYVHTLQEMRKHLHTKQVA